MGSSCARRLLSHRPLVVRPAVGVTSFGAHLVESLGPQPVDAGHLDSGPRAAVGRRPDGAVARLVGGAVHAHCKQPRARDRDVTHLGRRGATGRLARVDGNRPPGPSVRGNPGDGAVCADRRAAPRASTQPTATRPAPSGWAAAYTAADSSPHAAAGPRTSNAYSSTRSPSLRTVTAARAVSPGRTCRRVSRRTRTGSMTAENRTDSGRLAGARQLCPAGRRTAPEGAHSSALPVRSAPADAGLGFGG